MNESEKYKPWLSLLGAAQLVQKHVGDDDEVGDSLVETAKSITATSAKIEQTVTAIMGNQMEPELKRTKAAKDAAHKIAQPLLKRIDTTTAYARSAIETLTAQVQPRKPKDAMEALSHQEVRMALYRLPASERSRVVRQAIDDDDDVFVAGAVTGSPLLTGMGKAEQAVLLHAWQQKKHPDKLARITRLRAGLDQVHRIGPMFQSWQVGLFAEKNAAIAAAETSAEIAKAAMAGVANAS